MKRVQKSPEEPELLTRYRQRYPPIVRANPQPGDYVKSQTGLAIYNYNGWAEILSLKPLSRMPSHS